MGLRVVLLRLRTVVGARANDRPSHRYSSPAPAPPVSKEEEEEADRAAEERARKACGGSP